MALTTPRRRSARPTNSSGNAATSAPYSALSARHLELGTETQLHHHPHRLADPRMHHHVYWVRRCGLARQPCSVLEYLVRVWQ
uniref:Uncharacterized protein n=1 Tax=Leersia perrieri TaxID=77586 RepID=A0A0D9W407_9ORYZ